jgi:hypothetical protein
MTRLFNVICYITLIAVLTIIYFACFNLSYEGYGYPGHRGYHHHHSHWYFCSHDYAYDTSVRENSVSGSKFSRKGINGGK